MCSKPWVLLQGQGHSGHFECLHIPYVLVYCESTCLCPAHNFVVHGEISKSIGTNDGHTQKTCTIYLSRLKVKVTR